jgi:hypothetical protein
MVGEAQTFLIWTNRKPQTGIFYCFREGNNEFITSLFVVLLKDANYSGFSVLRLGMVLPVRMVLLPVRMVLLPVCLPGGLDWHHGTSWVSGHHPAAMGGWQQTYRN